MSNRDVCDRCKRVEGIDTEKLYEVSVTIVDTSIAIEGPEDNTVFWAEMDVCTVCLPIVEGLFKERLLTEKTPASVHGGEGVAKPTKKKARKKAADAKKEDPQVPENTCDRHFIDESLLTAGDVFAPDDCGEMEDPHDEEFDEGVEDIEEVD